MSDRYSFANEGPAPCNICDSSVHEQLVEGQMSFADARPPVHVERVCNNPECPSNTGEMSFADSV